MSEAAGPATERARWWALAALVLLLAVAAVNGPGLGSDPSPLTLLRFTAYLPMAVAAYLLGRLAGLPGTVPWWAAPSALLLGAAITALVADRGVGLTVLVFAGVGVMLPWAIGFTIRQNVLLAAAARERADHVEATREAYAHSALEGYRRRMARDVHDRLGHDLALLTLMAGRLEVATTGEAREQAAAIRAHAQDSTDRLRDYLDSLRESPALAASVADAVRTAQGAGLPVRLTGDAEHPLLVRTVTEALTNAAKHAGGSTVSVSAAPDAVMVSTAMEPGVPIGAWRGLRDLQDSVRAAGGSFRAGPESDAWVVEARVGGVP